jgi:hypothetical protein
MLARVDCATHEGEAAEASCAVCARPLCGACIAYDVDGRPTCEACGRAEEDRGKSVGTTLLALTAVGYLATLALGLLAFRARPFVGGVAAIVGIAIGRALQLILKPPVVVRRLRRS